MSLFSLPGKRPEHIGLQGSHLAPCPESPNCVCSDESRATHSIGPVVLAAPAATAWTAARKAVLALPRTYIVSERDDYLHAQCASALFGFIDDLELHLRAEQGIIAVRSASRLGYSDFGVNRRRVERVRAALLSAGVARA
jgi:uncharacterized protein (DUF1499 family)